MKFFNAVLLLPLLFFFSCDISDNEDIDPALSFVRIYDSEQFDRTFEPIDLIQTTDGGYIVLGGYRRDDTDFLGVYVMKTDSAGNFISDTFYPQEHVNPIGDIMEINGSYYFISMDAVGLGAYLNQLDIQGELVQSTALAMTYPMHAVQDVNEIILLSYDNNGKSTVLSTMSTEGGISKQQEFDIGAGDDVEEPIIEHFTSTGRQLPFFTGRALNGAYYFNGFYNFTLSLVFTNLNSGDPDGIVQGQQDDGGISGLMHLGGNLFSVSRFNFGDNFMNASTELAMNDITSSVDIEGNPMIEWVSDAKLKIIESQINNESFIISASTTNAQQIVLQFFERGTGNFRASEYLGFSNPYQFSSMKMTRDNGLVVLGKTLVAGRFSRLCLFKLSEDNLKELSR